jgi:Skp family chaperone for outer membrane proteins
MHAMARKSALSLTLISASLMLSVAWPAFAQTAPPVSSPVAAPPAAQAPAKAIVPLPAGAKVAFVNLQFVFTESDLGKQGQTRWRMLNEKLFSNLAARTKEIEGLSDKIKTQQNVIDEAILRAWNQDLARLQREAQLAQQEAQVQSDQMQQELLRDFETKIQPVIDALRVEKGLHAIVGVQSDPGGLSLLSSEPGIDLSAELVKRLNGQK